MEKRPIFPMTQLDTLVTTQELQLMKLMLPYIPANMRGMLAVYIKFTEFTNTIHLFHSTGNGSPDGPIHSKSIHSPEDILQDLSSVGYNVSNKSVTITRGAMAFTFTPFLPNSFDTVRIRPCWPDLDAA